MEIYILSIFPGMFESVFNETIIKRAQEKDLVKIELVNIRDFATDKHKTTDDYPYGGGAGMVMKPEPIYRAMDYVKEKNPNVHVILLSPGGLIFNQQKAKELSKMEATAIICGRYEGFDERIRFLADEEISLGKFVLSGGEIAAMAIVDATVRLIPGVLGNEESLKEESFENGLIEYPQYTRPRIFRGMAVPDILLSGNHKKIKEWREKKAKEKTIKWMGVEDG
ncbi:tRNA (guanosine(37)-N1)-methyltransferase TrmD [Hippea maritima]|uniref:tRNA (guanine-N(1)-)-methyltransferase n=1 Tax=Hippea maritima (strain ATCC 700847 / DSM 10411 / MH2) TaxID=760142 RepID=F2LY91_HIPMA|nr:tRNA (guanosine(37)-N1)-methyltransferase TrmD [Hippea maritima]AEA34414.1 tRNA (guanine-N(1)-)-methyltransferase [Hippea maritima DSM 10411]